jgi:hypothetical protein
VSPPKSETGLSEKAYKASCARTVRIDNGIGYVNTEQGKIKVSPTGPITYTLTATSNDGQTQETSVTVSDVTPSPVPTLISLPTPIPHKESFWNRLLYFIVSLARLCPYHAANASV